MPVEALEFADIIIHWIERRQMYAGTANRQDTDCVSASSPLASASCAVASTFKAAFPSPAQACVSSVGHPALAGNVIPTPLMRLAAAGQCRE